MLFRKPLKPLDARNDMHTYDTIAVLEFPSSPLPRSLDPFQGALKVHKTYVTHQSRLLYAQRINHPCLTPSQ